MLLKIDYREHFFINLLSIKFQQEFDHNIIYNFEIISFIILNLEIGDFIIYNSDDSILLIIERKSISDLCSSITDSRFREQKQRLLESTNDASKIMYLIEGKKYKTPININGAIQNLIFKHNYKVLITENEQDSFDHILLLFKKFYNNDFEILNNNVVVSLVKKKDKINDNIFAHQLNTISGVSMNIALELSKLYINMNNLILQYNNINDIVNKELMLSNIIINNRKIGKALSTKIYKSLH